MQLTQHSWPIFHPPRLARIAGLTVAAAGITALLTASQPVFAWPVPENFTLANVNGDVGIEITEGGSNLEGTDAGFYAGQLDGGTIFRVYCCDLTHNIGVPGNYAADINNLVSDPAGPATVINGNTYYTGGLASALTAADFNPTVGGSGTAPTVSERVSEVAWLADTFLEASSTAFNHSLSGSTSFQANEAAIGISIWDILQDGGDGVGTGQGGTYVDPTTAANYGSIVNYYENLATLHDTYVSYDVDWIQAPLSGGPSIYSHEQDFIAILPEPGISTVVGCMLIAFCLVCVRRLPKFSHS